MWLILPQAFEFTATLDALVDEVQSVEGSVVDTNSALRRTTDEGSSIRILVSEVDLPATRKCVDIYEPERLFLEDGGECVEKALENI